MQSLAKLRDSADYRCISLKWTANFEDLFLRPCVLRARPCPRLRHAQGMPRWSAHFSFFIFFVPFSFPQVIASLCGWQTFFERLFITLCETFSRCFSNLLQIVDTSRGVALANVRTYLPNASRRWIVKFSNVLLNFSTGKWIQFRITSTVSLCDFCGQV